MKRPMAKKDILLTRTVEVVSHKVKNRLAAISAMVQMDAPKERVLQEIEKTVFTLDDMVAWGLGEEGDESGCDLITLSKNIVGTVGKSARIVDAAHAAGKPSPLSVEEAAFIVKYLWEVVALQQDEILVTTTGHQEGYQVKIHGSKFGLAKPCDERVWADIASGTGIPGLSFGLVLVRWILRRRGLVLNVDKDENSLLSFSFVIKETKV